MIQRYTNPEMGAIWSDQRRYETWLAVELAATDAMAAAGLVPADAAKELRDKAAFDIARIEAIAGSTSASRRPTSSTPRRRSRCTTRAT